MHGELSICHNTFATNSAQRYCFSFQYDNLLKLNGKHLGKSPDTLRVCGDSPLETEMIKYDERTKDNI
jgi:hypothetical protein